jgi:ankyrin repeat protein
MSILDLFHSLQERLIKAAEQGDLAKLHEMLGGKSSTPRLDLNARDRRGQCALVSAVRNGHLEVVRFLLEKGAEVNTSTWGGTVLHEAIHDCRFDVARVLVEMGADVNGKAATPRSCS